MDISIPVGLSQSFTTIPANTKSPPLAFPATQYESGGVAIITFIPADLVNPGTCTLCSADGTVLLTMTTGGNYPFFVDSSLSYYFISTAAIAQCALTYKPLLRAGP